MRGGQEVCRDCRLREKEGVYEGGDVGENMVELRKLIRRRKEVLKSLKKELFEMRRKKQENPLRPIEGIEETKSEIDEIEEEVEGLEKKLQDAEEQKAKNPLIP